MNPFVPGPVRRLEFDVGPSTTGHPPGASEFDRSGRRAPVLRLRLIASAVGPGDGATDPASFSPRLRRCRLPLAAPQPEPQPVEAHGALRKAFQSQARSTNPTAHLHSSRRWRTETGRNPYPRRGSPTPTAHHYRQGGDGQKQDGIPASRHPGFPYLSRPDPPAERLKRFAVAYHCGWSVDNAPLLPHQTAAQLSEQDQRHRRFHTLRSKADDGRPDAYRCDAVSLGPVPDDVATGGTAFLSVPHS